MSLVKNPSNTFHDIVLMMFLDAGTDYRKEILSHQMRQGHKNSSETVWFRRHDLSDGLLKFCWSINNIITSKLCCRKDDRAIQVP